MRNNIKIKFDKPIYAVDEKNGEVVCTLRYKAEAPNIVIFASRGTIHGSPWYMNQMVKAIARAKDNDTFDVNVGKKVSLAKAENKVYSYVYELLKSTQKELANALDVIEDFRDKSQKVKKHNIEYMKKF